MMMMMMMGRGRGGGGSRGMEQEAGEGEVHGPAADEAQLSVVFPEPCVPHPALDRPLQRFQRRLRLEQVLRAHHPARHLLRERERI